MDFSVSTCDTLTPLPSPPQGEKPILPAMNICSGRPTCLLTKKRNHPIPSPVGAPQGCYAKGQADMPIAQPNQGEVTQNPSPVSPMGERPILPVTNICSGKLSLSTRKEINPIPSPLGRGPSGHADCSTQSG